MVWNTCMFGMLYSANDDPVFDSMVQSSVTDIKIYPNPLRSYCYIEAPLDEGVTTCSVFTMNGQLVIKERFYIENKGVRTIRMQNMEGLAIGAYVLQIKTPGKTYNEKLIKSNY